MCAVWRIQMAPRQGELGRFATAQIQNLNKFNSKLDQKLLYLQHLSTIVYIKEALDFLHTLVHNFVRVSQEGEPYIY